MSSELYNKYKDILSRICNCINEYIKKNIKNPSLVESKLLSINNYIIDILYTPEELQNLIINNPKENKSIPNIYHEKSITNSNMISSREYEEKKKTIDNFRKRYFNNMKEKNEKIIYSYNDNINSDLKLQLRKLKNERKKNVIKELPYLKKLSKIQKELYLYELKKNKTKERNNSNNNKINYFTINNTYKNRNLSNQNMNLHSFNSKMIKHSMSQCEIIDVKDKSLNNEKIIFDDMKLKYELFRKKKIMKRNNFIKFDFDEIKKSIEMKIDKIKGINLNLSLYIKKNKNK